jgi:hypothetical protein
MIRGAIEVANRSIISGWLYSQSVDLRGQLVLAFIGTRHVGTGKVEIFRKDLKDAGLGDGFSGFYFPLTILPTDQPEAVTVRLDQSDLSLLQQGSLVSQPPKKPGGPVGAPKTIAPPGPNLVKVDGR